MSRATALSASCRPISSCTPSESFGADLKLLHLSEKNGFLPDLDELRALAVPGTKMICINNPNNPTGALMTKDMLMQIVEIAKSVGAYVMCDEVYRHLTQDDVWSESIVDLVRGRGISVSSMSKVFSLPEYASAG